MGLREKRKKFILDTVREDFGAQLDVQSKFSLDSIAGGIAARRLSDALCADPRKYAGKVAVVTGATGNIGRCVARRFARQGASVALCARSADKLDALAQELGTSGTVAAFPLDITDEESIAAAFAAIRERFGGIDVLANCAGGGGGAPRLPLLEQSADIIRTVVESNLTGAILLSKHAALAMRQRGGGHIVHLSSVIAGSGRAGYSDYAAAKAGLNGFVRTLAIELGEYNVTVNCVSPGTILKGETTDFGLRTLATTNVLLSAGTAEDAAAAVDFLAGDSAGFITGQELIVDGGRSLGLRGE